jgi:hypothetical protein
MIAVVPIAVPIARMMGEDVFLPVTAQTVLSIPVIVCIPEICIPEIVCVPNIVSIPNNVSIAEVRSGISLVPHVCDRGISRVRESREAIPLIDGYSGIWTRTGNGYSILIDRMLLEGSRTG